MVRAFNEQRPAGEIVLEAEKAEGAAERGKSTMKMTESLLFRFIYVRKQRNHALLQTEMNRVNSLLSSEDWKQLAGLLHWLHQQYVNMVTG
ncbi:hypothetical protein H0H93_002595 [Arthromyces matolae]|nr:hypothetical protein H0H93_002595 [Arthromyces matolae]